MSFLFWCGPANLELTAATFSLGVCTPLIADLSGFDGQGKLPSSARLTDRQAGSGNRARAGLGLGEPKRLIWRMEIAQET